MVIDMTSVPGFLPRAGLDRLLDLLAADGRRIIGPTVSQGAVVYDEIHRASDLPSGWAADQAPGVYRLRQTGTDRQFDYVDRTDLLEARDLPTPGADHDRPSGGRPDDVRGCAAGRAGCRLPRRPRLRDRGPADPGRGPDPRTGGRPRLRRPSRRGADHRRRVRDRGGHVLLHVHGHRPRSDDRFRPRDDRTR